LIKTLADILQGIVKKEKAILDEINIPHGPTIGDMYEGLTSALLATALPDDLNIEIGTGFITDGHNNLSHEVDCIIATAPGTPIPYTEKSTYHIKDVLAVFEVKKTINPSEFEDSFEKMRSVKHLLSSWIDNDRPKFISNHPMVERAYKGIRFKIPPIELNKDDLESHIFSILQIERLCPARIIIGYDGWVKESTLRNNLYSYLEGKSTGYGVASFPDLIISGENTLVKVNGFPYMLSEPSDEWPFICSTHCNPILPMLEILWTKLSLNHKVGNFWGDDINMESMTPCLWGTLINKDGKFGWSYRFSNLKESNLSATPAYTSWEPTEISLEQHVAFGILAHSEEISLEDENFINFIQESKLDFDAFIDDMVGTGMVTITNNKLVFISTECTTCISDGKFYVADNYDGRLTAWTKHKFHQANPGEPFKILRIKCADTPDA